MKAADFEQDILRLRREGETYDSIALWIATNKKVVVSTGAIRNILKKNELMQAAKK
ncbi:hypothetical protein ALO82_200098 [Pseudomonas syringae pv. broussonetiae]|uniref:Uncharacterized protein n=2 Tax=Pseudomonas syringae group genomosp. 2 TaxID=251698 RepID=A0A3M5J315_PSESS|nr:hypothetical protein ALO82_200098 [Pseudomonas syringae pv. broussonetiae]KPX86347.1 hypothetical protein ALO64_200050 [Pseudomonas meliae]RMS29117.1 hypothetical protein ALP70_200148 [Pseudomonas savastanoi]RMT17583.1 hypothetical protein ALP51_200039 [Pseudomonas savastanoi]GAO94511.1 hypothetical protein PSA5_17360 [Pseudomonas syringae pv. actinidiae]